jgi:putative ABC transport system substrate-binding protein
MAVISRRGFLALLAAAAWSQVGHAQPANRTYRLAILSPTPLPPATDRNAAVTLIPQALADLGYATGRNLVLDLRSADGRLERLPDLARELVRLRPDVIVAISLGSVRATRQATSAIPIVFYGNFDPLAAGLVKSLARPAGNLTGVLIAPAGTLAGKKLELLREMVPRATRIALLAPDDPAIRFQVQETQQAATALGVKLLVTEVRERDYERAFAAIVAQQPDALFVAAHTYFVRDRKRIIQLAARSRLPAMYEWPEQVEDGGLMSYGSSLPGTTRRVAAYVDRLFKGARIADLPIEQPAEFQLVLNLRTARTLGLTVPPALVARADRVIE